MILNIGELAYSKGYRYQVRLNPCSCTSKIRLEADIITPWFTIRADGLITAHVGYAWNGANKPAINTKSFVRPSLFHDIVRQAVAEGLLDPKWLDEGDRLMRRIARADKMRKIRRWWTFKAVNLHGKLIASKRAGRGDRKIMYFPSVDLEDDLQ